MTVVVYHKAKNEKKNVFNKINVIINFILKYTH